MAIENYIGKGLTFPIQINKTGGVDLETGFALINSSIKNILLWPTHQRIFLSEYGSMLDTLIEEPNDVLLVSLVENFIYKTLTTWEKRIEIIEVYISGITHDRLYISIVYKLSKSNLEETFTFPYYRNLIY